MTLSRADLEAIRAVIREEVAAATDSGRRSTSGIGALVQGADQWHEKDENESMDLTSTVNGGESSSPEQTAAKLLSRSRASPRRNVLQLRHGRKAKAER